MLLGVFYAVITKVASNLLDGFLSTHCANRSSACNPHLGGRQRSDAAQGTLSKAYGATGKIGERTPAGPEQSSVTHLEWFGWINWRGFLNPQSNPLDAVSCAIFNDLGGPW